MLNESLIVSAVEPGSIAEKYGIKKNDRIISCNGHKIYYDLDFAFYEQVKNLSIKLIREGNSIDIKIKKDKYECIGVYFDIPIKSCKNKCIFCFIDQMPKNMRKTLYIKDEDIRQSFLFGAYITASEMDLPTLDYIRKLKIYPLYISIHSTDQENRNFIIGKEEKIPIMDKLKIMKKNKIIFHGQIVLIPDINDKEVLYKSISDLAELYPYLNSLAVVPVGVTKYRKRLFKIRDFSKAEVKSMEKELRKMQMQFLKKHGTRFVFLADEFFLKMKKNLPNNDYYEDYSQISNGIGLIRIFQDDFNKGLYRIKKSFIKCSFCQPLYLVTGSGFAPVLKKLIDKWNCRFQDNIEIIEVKNVLFGNTVNVAGLLSMADIENHIKEIREGLILIPDIILNENGYSIDNKYRHDIEKLYKNINFIRSNAEDLILSMRQRLKSS